MKLFIYVCVFIAALNLSQAFECGLEGSASRIYKGKKVRAHKYPWLAHLRIYLNRRSGSFSQCGGSLVNEKTIITAAHCVANDEGVAYGPERVDVYLGNVKAFTDKTKPMKVAKVWIDPSYNPQDLGHDFAILTLEKTVKFTNTIAPICLPTSEDGINQLMVSGWGTTAADEDSSNDLLEAEVEFISDDECNKIQGRYLLKENNIPLSKMDAYFRKGLLPTILDTHICAVNKKTGSDACAGDSGGPLMHKTEDGRWVLMAVVSGSWTDCGTTEDIAGLYTRTVIYEDKIKETAPNAVWVDL